MVPSSKLKSKKTSFNLPPDLKKRLELEKRRGASHQDIIIEALHMYFDWLDNEETKSRQKP